MEPIMFDWTTLLGLFNPFLAFIVELLNSVFGLFA